MKRMLPFWMLWPCLAIPAAALAQTLDDPLLTVDVVAGGGLSAPTTMTFVAPDDILVLEKDTGNVRRVLNGVVSAPILTLPANTDSERGALGIAADTSSPPRVFIYFTEAATFGGPAIANRVYRYDWNPVSGTLDNPTLVLDLPVTPGPNHNGGALLLGPPGEAPGVGDGSLLYAVIGDLNRATNLQNVTWASPGFDNTSVILRVRQDGSAAPGNPFAPFCSVSTATLCDDDGDCPGGQTCRTRVGSYYAYGVRNSFGLALDPATGSLWDTENGVLDYDEVNRVTPGMNSGWIPIMGPDARSPGGVGDLFHMPNAGVTYSDPEFSWLLTIAPTGIAIPYQSSLGPAYDDAVIVADINLGQLYALPLNASRTGFEVAGISGLADLVADNHVERDALRFGTGFYATDLEMGPDGHLYVLRIAPGGIFRIRGPGPSIEVPVLPMWAPALLALALGAGGVISTRVHPKG